MRHVAATGGTPHADQAAADCLRDITPIIQQPQAASESWEQLTEHSAASDALAARLVHLQHVVWPDITTKLLQRLAFQCPKVQINAFQSSNKSGKVCPPSNMPLQCMQVDDATLSGAQITVANVN